MPSLWNLGKTSKEELEETWEEDGLRKQKMDEHRHKFEDDFREAMQEDVPTHPYKIYRDIVENRDLQDEEKVVLEYLKDEYAEKWQELKQKHSSIEGPAKKVFEGSKDEKIPDQNLHDLMNAIIEQIISMESFMPYANSPGEKAIDGKFNFVPEDNEIIAEKYFEFLEKK